MSIHRYPAAALRTDYLRASAGFMLTAGLGVLARGEVIAVAVFGICAFLFLAFGLRTWRRQVIVIAIDEEGISTSGGRCVTLPWKQLTAYKLRYYATKRDRTGGWMQLTLAAGKSRLSIESTLDGFIEVARYAARAAEANGVPIDTVTRNNLTALRVVPVVDPT